MCNARHGKPECHFLYLAYRCYRELRLGDDNYGPRWTSDLHKKQQELCRSLRHRDMVAMYDTASGSPWREVLNPFVDRTGFHVEDLPAFFAEPIWKTNYGGGRWAKIAQHALDLRGAVDSRSPSLEELVAGAYELEHNSGYVIGDSTWPGCCLGRRS